MRFKYIFIYYNAPFNIINLQEMHEEEEGKQNHRLQEELIRSKFNHKFSLRYSESTGTEKTVINQLSNEVRLAWSAINKINTRIVYVFKG